MPVLIGYLIEVVFLTDGFGFFLRHLPFGIDHVTKTLFQQFHFLPLPVAYGSQFDVRFQQGVFVEDQPVIGSAGIDKGDLQIGCLLTGVYLRRSDQMIDEKASFCIGSHDAELVHSFFRRALHIAFITYPCSAPTGEVDAKRKRGAYLAILQELEPNLLVLGLLIVHPYDESRKIGVFPRRVFLLKLQVFPEFQSPVRFEGPFQRMFPVFIMCTGYAQLRLNTGYTGR